MSLVLIPSPRFIRAVKQQVKGNAKIAVTIEATLKQLAEDPFQPALRSHLLKGKLKGSWACSAGYDLRIIFSIIKHERRDTILLETVGTHDEVY